MSGETIVAAATPPGRGGIAVVRISGPDVPKIAFGLLGRLPVPRLATYGTWHDEAGAPLDSGLALYFPAPASFTGEHVLELQGHGGTVVVASIIERIAQLGARHARAGEFTERAYLNDKIDLAQAEAVADLIDAGSRAAARAALRSLQGEFSARVRATREALVALRVYVEAAIDFPEEEIDFLASAELRERVEYVQQRLDEVLAAARQGAVLTQGATVVIAGRPNAGKSTLLNRLAGHDAAIVTPVPGTTRDLLRERIEIDGMPVELIDTAGLRELSADPIEREGMRRARDVITRADHLLFVVDAVADPAADAWEEERSTFPDGLAVTLVMNKMDLAQTVSRSDTARATASDAAGPPRVLLSASTGEGLDSLRKHLLRALGFVAGEGSLSARSRHVDALERAAAQLAKARAQLVDKQGELAALDLRAAQQSLGEVMGDVSSDELLGRIFSSFCIGK